MRSSLITSAVLAGALFAAAAHCQSEPYAAETSPALAASPTDAIPIELLPFDDRADTLRSGLFFNDRFASNR